MEPVPLFKLTDVKTSGGLRPFAVTRDGQHFLMNVPADTAQVPIAVVFNWHPAEIKNQFQGRTPEFRTENVSLG